MGLTEPLPAPPIERLAEAESLLLGSDFDGTLAPIGARHRRLALPRIARESLRDLAALPRTTIAILSGRPLVELDSIASIRGVWLAGYHGAEIRDPRTSGILHAGSRNGWTQPSDAGFLRMTELARSLPGVSVEYKPAGIAIHWRETGRSDPPPEVGELASVLEASPAPGTRLIRGRCFIEVNGTASDKGGALRGIGLQLDPPPEIVCYLGDDLTDEDAFRSLPPGGIGIQVVDESSPRERPGPTAASFSLPGPRAVSEFLRALATRRAGVRA